MKHFRILICILLMSALLTSVAVLCSCKDGGGVADGELKVSLENAKSLGAAVSGSTVTVMQGNEAFTRENLVKALSVKYSEDGETRTVTDIAVSWGGFKDASDIGEYSVTVVYYVDSLESSTTFNIKVIAVTLSSIEIGGAKASFDWGSDFSAEGLTVTALYSDGKSKGLVDGYYVDASAYDKNTTGSYVINVTYAEGGDTAKASYTVSVGNAPFDHIEISGGKKVFEYGAAFDYSALKVTAIYKDGSASDVTKASVVDYGTFNKLQKGNYVISVSYTEGDLFGNASYEVEVLGKVPTSLTVVGAKNTFSWGEDFSSENIVVTVSYEFAEDATVSKGYAVDASAFDKSKAGTYEIKISYTENDTEVTASYFVTVKEPMLSYITVAGGKSQFAKGESFELTGAVVTAYLEDGTHFTVENPVFDDSEFNTAIEGNYEIQASYTYNGKTCYTSYTATVGEARLVSLKVQSLPTKNRYKVGEGLNYSGISLLATYTDDSTDTITAEDAGIIIALNFSTSSRTAGRAATFFLAGNASVVTSDSFTYSVYDDITGIAITKYPDKAVYHKADSGFDFTGMEYSIKYAGSADETGLTYDAAVLNVTSFNNTSAGSKVASIVHRASGKSASFSYTVEDRVTAVVTTMPKTMYLLDDSLDLGNGAIKFARDYGNKSPVTVAMTDLTEYLSGFDASIGTTTAAGRELVFTFKNYSVLDFNFTGEVKVEYHVATPASMAFVGGAEKPFAYHNLTTEAYDVFGGGGVEVTYSDGYIGTIDFASMSKAEFNEKFVVTGINTTAIVTDSYATITYIGYPNVTARVAYDVVDWVSKVAVISAPTKKEYYKGDSLDIAGVNINVFFNSATTTAVQYSLEKAVADGLVTLSGFATLAKGKCQVNICRVPGGNVLASFDVTVLNKPVALAVVNKPTKLDYYLGDEINLANCTIKIIHDFSEDDAVVSADDARFTCDYHFIATGSRNVIVALASNPSISTSFSVTVNSRKATSISFVSYPKQSYYVNEPFIHSEAKLKVTFEVGSDAEIALFDTEMLSITQGFSLSGFDTSAVCTDKVVTVSYDGDGDSEVDATTEFKISVSRLVVGISVKSNPDKIDYKLGDELKLDGGVVTISYADTLGNEELPMSSDKFTLQGFDSAEAGTKTMFIAYSAYTTMFTVNVNAPKPQTIRVAVESDVDGHGKKYSEYGYTNDAFAFDWRENFSEENLVLYVTYDYAYGEVSSAEFIRLPAAGYEVFVYGYEATSLDNESDIYEVEVTYKPLKLTCTYQVTRGEREKYIYEFKIAEDSPHVKLVGLGEVDEYDTSAVAVEGLYKWSDTSEEAGSVLLTYGSDYTVDASDLIGVTSTGDRMLTINIIMPAYLGNIIQTKVTVADTSVVTLEWGYLGDNVSAWYGYSKLSDIMKGLTLFGKDAVGTIRLTYTPDNASQFTSNFDSVVTGINVGSTVEVEIAYGTAITTFNVEVKASPAMTWKTEPVAVSPVTSATTFASWIGDTGVALCMIELDFGEGTKKEIAISDALLKNNWSDVIASNGATPLHLICGTSYVSTAITISERQVNTISIYKEPTKSTYYAGQSADYAGGILLVNYNDGTVDYVDMTDSSVTKVCYDKDCDLTALPVGIVTVTFIYGGKEVYLVLKIAAESITNSWLNANGTPKVVAVGTQLDCSAITISYQKASGGETEYSIDSTAFEVDYSMLDNVVDSRGIIKIHVASGDLSGMYFDYEVYVTSETAIGAIADIMLSKGSDKVEAYKLTATSYIAETSLGAGVYVIEVLTANPSATAEVSLSGGGVINAVNYDGTNAIEMSVKVTESGVTSNYTLTLCNYTAPIAELTIGGKTVDAVNGECTYYYNRAEDAVIVAVTTATGCVAIINDYQVSGAYSATINDDGIYILAGRMSSDNKMIGNWQSFVINFAPATLISSLKVNGDALEYDDGYDLDLTAVKSAVGAEITVASGYEAVFMSAGQTVATSALPLVFGDNEFTIRVSSLSTCYYEDYILHVDMPYTLAFDSIEFAVTSYDTEFDDVVFDLSYGGTTIKTPIVLSGQVLQHKIALKNGFTLVGVSTDEGAFSNVSLSSAAKIMISKLDVGTTYYRFTVNDGSSDYSLVIPIEVPSDYAYNGDLANDLKVTVCGIEVHGDNDNGFYVNLPIGYPSAGLKDTDIIVDFGDIGDIGNYNVNVFVENSGSKVVVNLHYGESSTLCCVMEIAVNYISGITADLDVCVSVLHGKNVVTFTENSGVYVGTLSAYYYSAVKPEFIYDAFTELEFDSVSYDGAFNSDGSLKTDAVGNKTVTFKAIAFDGTERSYALTISIGKKSLLNVSLKGSDGVADSFIAYENGDYDSDAMFMKSFDGKTLTLLSAAEYLNSYGFSGSGNSGTVKLKFDLLGYGSGATLWQGSYSASNHAHAQPIAIGSFVDVAVSKSAGGVWSCDFYAYNNGVGYNYSIIFVDAFVGFIDDYGAFYVSPDLTNVLGESDFEYDSDSGEYLLSCDLESVPFAVLGETIEVYIYTFGDSKVFFNSASVGGAEASVYSDMPTYIFGTKVFKYSGTFTATDESSAEFVFTIQSGSGTAYTYRIIAK